MCVCVIHELNQLELTKKEHKNAVLPKKEHKNAVLPNW
jgi:hypothetical protein